MKLINAFSKSMLLTSASAVLLFSSCKKDDDPVVPPPTPQPTVVGVAQSNANFSILVRAVERAGLVTTLSDLTKNYTVFAPTNAAFEAAGYPLATINGLTDAQVTTVLTPILTYHVLGAKVASTGVPVSDTVKTVNGKNLFASRNANGVFLNGIKVVTADLAASNGVVHVIDKVLVPPTQTIAQLVTSTPSLSLLLTAVQRASAGATGGGLVAALSAPGKYTVFAPVNTGFPASLDTDAEINAAPQATVAGILGSHAFTTNIFAGDLVAGNTPATLNPATTLTIGLTPSPNVKITGSAATASGITTTNIVATNGVVHLIDKVLQ
jgi:uncharacterized surface protein with fasciclin (FAS1) repeats